MGRDTKVGRLRARALTLLITSPRRGLSQLTYVSGTLVRDPEGRVHFFFFGGKPINVSPPPSVSQQNSHPFNHKFSGCPCFGLRPMPKL